MIPVLLRGELYLAMSIPRRLQRHVPKVGANRSSRLTASPDIWICDPLKPPKMPPAVLWGDFYLAYVHSHMNPQTWTTVGANRSSRFTASPDFWMFDPLNPQVPHCVSKVNLFGVYPFPDEYAHVCQIWCHSVQPFDSFNRRLNL